MLLSLITTDLKQGPWPAYAVIGLYLSTRVPDNRFRRGRHRLPAVRRVPSGGPPQPRRSDVAGFAPRLCARPRFATRIALLAAPPTTRPRQQLGVQYPVTL